MAAAGEITQPGYGKSNVDNRTFFALVNRGLVEYGEGWYGATPQGLVALGLLA